MSQHLLLVEDDDKLARLLRTFFSQEGYRLSWAAGADEARAKLAERPALILLDVMLPDQDGFSFCQELRASGDATPIILLTGRGAEQDRITGLRLGADDYLPKPFNPHELLARIEAVLRRSQGGGLAGQPGLDRDRKVLRLGEREFPLTLSEYRLLEVLTSQPGRVFSREQLLAHLDADGGLETSDRAVDVHISRLRTKIEKEPRRPQHLFTERGLGYRFAW